MPADNVTPFRRPAKRRPVAPQQEGGFGLKTHRGKAVLAHLLTIGAFTLNFFFPLPPLSFVAIGVAIAGVVVAYSSREGATPWAATHHEHALRTLIIGYAVSTLGSLLTYVHGSLAIVSYVIAIGVIIWAVLRAIVALVLAVMRRPVPHPRGWFV